MNDGSSLVFLTRAATRARRLPLAGALALALLAFGLNQAVMLGWWQRSLAWGFMPGAGAVALVAVWIARGRTLTPAALARRLDDAWSLSARLETSVELARDNTPLATAQRIDTAERTAHQAPPETGTWQATLVLLVLVALLVIGELAVTTARWLPTINVRSAAAPPAEKPDAFSASIRWRNPESEIKATAIEEVPLTAEFAASAVPSQVTLEVSVNGEFSAAQPLMPADLARLTGRGPHELALSLYLDEVGAQEFDIVAYHLRAGFPGRPAPVTSPLQFIQIRPPREDVLNPGEDGAPPDSEAMTTIRELKAAQLQLVKANFLLAHDSAGRADPRWRADHALVTEEQKILAQKTTQLHALTISRGAPALVVDNLGQAFQQMETAASALASQANEAAINPQNRALALLTATEKLLVRTLARAPRPTVPDPFKDPQQYRLPDRKQTPAGQLEELARKQAEVSRQLETGTGDQTANQKQLAADLEALTGAHSLDPAVQPAVERAARDAAEAAQQLQQGDRHAARSPAASAAEQLAQALATQEIAGRKNADAALEAARRELNEADRLAAGERAARLAELARGLQADAGAQQQRGSEQAARELASVGRTVGEAAGQFPQPGPGEAAARAQGSIAPRQDLLARAARQLERSRARLTAPNAGGVPESAAEALLGAQLAEVLLPANEAELARKVTKLARQLGDQPGDGTLRARFGNSLGRLIAALETARASGQRDEFVRRFQPDDLDPAYRGVIEKYFEQLSRRRTP